MARPRLFAAAAAVLCAPALSAAGWKRHGGVRCDAGHGATDLESPKGSSCGVMTLDACKQECENKVGCTAVVHAAVNITWTKHKGYNCYDKHGATEMTAPNAPFGDWEAGDCDDMTLDECKTQCFLTEGCEGVGVTSDGDCCLRSGIQISKCDSGGDWDTHVLSPSVAGPSGACYRRADVVIADCDTVSEGADTYVADEKPASPWWLTTHFAERTLMPRHYKCSDRNATCTIRDLEGMLPQLQDDGYSVVNVDWPVDSGPDSLYEGFGAKDFMAVDPKLGTEADWTSFTAAAHARGMRVMADFNPSYFWTGAPAFKTAIADVKQYGVVNLPPDSPARWFRWTESCPGAKEQPDDSKAKNGYTDGWVHSSAAGACYWSVWGQGEPCGDFARSEWRAQLTKIFTYWAGTGVDGFLLDAPPSYLASAAGVHDGLHDASIAKYVRSAIVEPMHALGVAVMGEMYNFGRPTVAKMLDGGRNTDMPSGMSKSFPGKVNDMVTAGDASGLEALLVTTVDRWVGWCGTPRTEPYAVGTAAVAGQQAAVTALLAGYYYVRMGATYPCADGYDASPPGDAWPGGCFGDWAGAKPVAPTLKAAARHAALRPGTPRVQLDVSTGGKGVYAALRGGGSDRAVVVFNFKSSDKDVIVEFGGAGVGKQTSTDLINGGAGPAVDSTGSMSLSLPAHGWGAYAVVASA